MPAENPCVETVIEVGSFNLRRARGVELISAPGGYNRIISSGQHCISPQSYIQLRRRLYPHQGGYERIEICGVDIADGNDLKVVCRGGVNSESRACAR